MDIIPFKNLPSFRQEISLDGIPYIIELNFNSRFEYWSLSISTSDDILLISGIKLVINYPLLSPFFPNNRDLPPGELFCLHEDITNNKRIEKDDFINGITNLVYFNIEELN